jgi:hypothetical protein
MKTTRIEGRRHLGKVPAALKKAVRDLLVEICTFVQV